MNKTYRFAFVMGMILALCVIFQIQAGTILLEQGNYAEETLGDLDKAIVIYEQIVRSTNFSREDVAEALFRLGQCHLKKGNRSETITTLKKLVMNYSDQTSFIWEAKLLLAKLDADTPVKLISANSNNNFAEKALMTTVQSDNKSISNQVAKNQKLPHQLNTPKWPHGMTRKWRVSATHEPSLYKTGYSSINAATINGIKYWCLEGLDTLSKTYGRVFIEQGTFKPRFSYSETELQIIQINYSSEAIKVKANQQGVLWEKHVPLNRFVFDSIQSQFLIELLPLKVGFKEIIPIFSPGNFEVFQIRINVIGTESVTVPAGTFDCFKVIFEFQSEGKWLKANEAWFTIDKKIPVKAILQNWTIFELEKTTLEPKSISNFQESALESLYKR